MGWAERLIVANGLDSTFSFSLDVYLVLTSVTTLIVLVVVLLKIVRGLNRLESIVKELLRALGLEPSSVKVLKKYALTERFEEAIGELSGFVDPSKLAHLLLCLKKWGYKLEGFTLLKDPESGEPLTVAVHIKGCSFEEWEVIEKSIKQKLLEEGLSDLLGKVTIVCIDAFKPSKGGVRGGQQAP